MRTREPPLLNAGTVTEDVQTSGQLGVGHTAGELSALGHFFTCTVEPPRGVQLPRGSQGAQVPSCRALESLHLEGYQVLAWLHHIRSRPCQCCMAVDMGWTAQSGVQILVAGSQLALTPPLASSWGDLRVWDGCAQIAKAGSLPLVPFSPIAGLGGLSLDQCPWLPAPGTQPQLTPKSSSACTYTRGPTPTTSRSRSCVETGDILL